MWYMTTDESTKFTRVKRLNLFSSLPFHLGSLVATLAISFCSSSLRNLPRDRGNPRYLHDSDASAAWKSPGTDGMSILLQLMGTISDF
jgi:hypothetical protein